MAPSLLYVASQFFCYQRQTRQTFVVEGGIRHYIKCFPQLHSSAGLAEDNMHLCTGCICFGLLHILGSTRLVFHWRGALLFDPPASSPPQILSRSRTIPLRTGFDMGPSCRKVSGFLLLNRQWWRALILSAFRPKIWVPNFLDILLLVFEIAGEHY